MLTIKEILKAQNVAELLDEEELVKIGQQVLVGYKIDDDSRGDLKDRLDNAMKIATQVMEAKNEPWPQASNIKFPLIAYAAIAFSSKEYPELIKDNRVVKTHIEGNETDAILMKRGENVSRFMSYQLLYESTDWEVGKDKLLPVLSVVGTCFDKVYFDLDENTPCVDLCMPDKVVVNNNITCLEDARRITHEMILYRNTIVEKQRNGDFCEYDLSDLPSDSDVNGQDSDPAFTFLEQHNFLDLDGDGYAEPYIVTIHKDSGKVFCIYPRFKEEDIKRNKKGQIRKITPENYFIDYHFIPSPDGGFYSVGWGQLLYPINETINTSMNQIIDSANLNNRPCGFLARGARIKEGDMYFVPGEFKTIDTAGQALQDVIMPLPTKEPSQTLFNTMNLLIEVGKELSGLTDLNMGQSPGQNVPATTVLSLLENSRETNEAIHKRLYKSLQKEFARIFELDKEYIKDDYYQAVLKDSSASVQYDFSIRNRDIVPVADPAMASDTARLIKAQAVMSIPGLQPQAQQEYMLEAIKVDQSWIQKLIPPPPDPNAPPPPDAQKTLAEAAAAQARAVHYHADAQARTIESQHKLLSLGLDAANSKVEAQHTIAKTQKLHADTIGSLGKTQDMAAKTQAEVAKDQFDALHEVHQSHFDNQIKAIEQMRKDMELSHKQHQAAMQNTLAQMQLRQKEKQAAQQIASQQTMQAQQQEHEQSMAEQQAQNVAQTMEPNDGGEE